MSNCISSDIRRLLDIPRRLQNVVNGYLLSLMLPAPKHSLTFASSISGLCKSQFSRMLGKTVDLAVDSLTGLVMQAAGELAANRSAFVKGTPWTIAIVIDATLQSRSSRHPRNSQKFNHGQGFVLGHQWTNIGIVIDGQFLPLPPIPFYSRNECHRRGLEYRTEHERIVEFLGQLDLDLYVGHHSPSEVVVLMDSGYDSKTIQRAIIGKGWDFVGALKSSRGVQTDAQHGISNKEFSRVDDLFWANRKHSPWKTIRDLVDGWKRKKRKEFRARELTGYLKGISRRIKLVCSEERGSRKGRKHIVCSNVEVSVGAVVRAYRRRWIVEIFHKEVKSCLGFEDVAVKDFYGVSAHVHWVYCAYILSKKLYPSISSLTQRQQLLLQKHENQPYREILQLSTRFDGARAVKSYCFEAISPAEAA